MEVSMLFFAPAPSVRSGKDGDLHTTALRRNGPGVCHEFQDIGPCGCVSAAAEKPAVNGTAGAAILPTASAAQQDDQVLWCISQEEFTRRFRCVRHPAATLFGFLAVCQGCNRHAHGGKFRSGLANSIGSAARWRRVVLKIGLLAAQAPGGHRVFSRTA